MWFWYSVLYTIPEFSESGGKKGKEKIQLTNHLHVNLNYDGQKEEKGKVAGLMRVESFKK